MRNERFLALAAWFLRFALGAGFLSAVADRFGLWGPNGAPRVAWGDWPHFCAYTAQLNWFLPKSLISATAWIATLAEAMLGLALILGVRLRLAALVGAVLLTLFALAMVSALGIKAPLDYSVFSAAGGAMLLSAISRQAPRKATPDAAWGRLQAAPKHRHTQADSGHSKNSSRALGHFLPNSRFAW